MSALRTVGIIILILGLFFTLMESILVSGFCATKPIIGPTLLYLAVLLLIYDFYKKSAIGKIALLVIIIFASAVYGYHMLNEWKCYSGNLPQSEIMSQLSKAYSQHGTVASSTSNAFFRKNIVYPSNSFEENVGGIGVVFGCSSELQNACMIEDSGTKLTILKDFSALVSACCTNTLCTVEIGEAAKC